MKKKYVKLIGAVVFSLCAVVAVGVNIIRTEASDAGVEYVSDVAYVKDDTAPANPEGLDEYLFAGWYANAGTEEKPVYKPVSNPVLGETYIAKYVHSDVLGIKAQVSGNILEDVTSNTADNAIRFVTSLDSDNYKKIGFNMKIGDYYEEDVETTEYVYKKIYAIGAAEGDDDLKYEPGTTFHPASEYFKTYTFTDIPESYFNTDITVTPYWVTLDGTRVSGTTAIRTANYCRGWYYVDSTADAATGDGRYNNPTTLANAVAINTQTLIPTVYLKSNITLDAQVTVEKSMTITSASGTKTITGVSNLSTTDAMICVSGANTDKVVTVNIDHVVFEGNGTGKSVRALAIGENSNDATLHITNATIQNFKSSKQGGSLLVRGTVYLENSTIKDGSSSAGGGLVNIDSGTLYIDKDSTLSNGSVSNNMAGGCVRIAAQGILWLQGGTIENGQSTGTLSNKGQGGNVWCAGTLNMSSGEITGGHVATTAVQITETQENGTITTINPDYAGSGGNIYANATGKVNISGGVICGGSATTPNESYVYGGGNIFIREGSLNITGGTISGGTASCYGGNIFVYKGTHSISGANIQKGTATESGGNVYAVGTADSKCSIIINDSQIIDGKATSSINDNVHGTGGNIYIDYAIMDVTDTTIKGGQSINSRGGNIYIRSNSTLNLNEGSLVEDGVSHESGGNIMVNKSSQITVRGGIIQNGESENAQGGNILMSTGTTIRIYSGSILKGISKNEGANLCLINDSVFELAGGEVKITGGKKSDGMVSNLYLPTEKTVTVTGELTGETSIGVTVINGECIFANGDGVTEMCQSYFFSDAADRETVYNAGDSTLSFAFMNKYTADDYLANSSLFIPVWANERNVPKEMLNFEEKWEQFFTPNGRMMSVAHRGDWQHYPENSAEAFLSAIMAGSDIVEVDLAITKDGKFVVMHDDTLTRTTNVAVARKNNPNLPESDYVQDWTLDELRQLRLRQGKGGSSAPVTSCIIPTLEEVIRLCNNRVFITLDKMNRLEILDDMHGVSLSGVKRWSEYLLPLIGEQQAYRTVMLPYSYTHVNSTTANYDAKYKTVQSMLDEIYEASGITSALMSRVEVVEQLADVVTYVEKYNFPRVLRSGEYDPANTEKYLEIENCFEEFRVHIECLQGNDYLEMWKQIDEEGYGIIVTNDICGLTEYIQEKEFKSIQVAPSPFPKPGNDSQTWPINHNQ